MTHKLTGHTSCSSLSLVFRPVTAVNLLLLGPIGQFKKKKLFFNLNNWRHIHEKKRDARCWEEIVQEVLEAGSD